MSTTQAAAQPTFREYLSKAYSFLFGASSGPQVLMRCTVDLALVAAALLCGAIARQITIGALAGDTTLGEAVTGVWHAFTSNIGLFAGFAVMLFVGSRLYRPVPSARIGKRIFDIGLACLLGVLLHLGAIALVAGDLTRGTIASAWAMLFVLVAGSRVVRMYMNARFQVTSRTKAPRQNRVDHVLVVGGAGYIGSVLTHQLLDAGYRVRVLDLQLFGDGSLDGVRNHPRLQIEKGDFRNVEDVVRSLRGVDAVVHLAAIVGDPACAVDEETTIAVNYGAAKMIAQLARAHGISRFVFASTCSVYGASDSLIDEKSTLNPVSLYATTKIDAERALLEVADDVFQPTILRLATAYGWSHRPRFDLVANLLSARAVTERDITIFNGEQWRPFVNTRDIARSMVMTLEAPLEKVGSEIFNVGDDSQNYTLAELGDIVAAQRPGTVVNQVRNDEDPRNYRVCFAKIRNTIGFRCSVTLQEGIHEIVAAVEGGKVADWKDPIHSNFKQMQGPVLNVLREDVAPRDDERELQETRRFLRRAG